MVELMIPQEVIQNKIFLIRGKKVMLDQDLAKLYGVETKQLKRAVKRNLSRFPLDFMFKLTPEEQHSLRYHFGTLEKGAHSKYLSYAFTDYGILMLSSVLKSQRATQVNIQIIKAFIQLREMFAGHKELKQKIETMEKKYDHQFKIVFQVIKDLLEPPQKSKKPIGFKN